jgi:hypothetical protein
MSKYLTIVYDAQGISPEAIHDLVKVNPSLFRQLYWGHAIRDIEKLKKESSTRKIYRNKYKDLKYEIKHALEDARKLYEDMKGNGLVAGTIESEGFLRGLLTAHNLFDYIDDMYKEERDESNN